MAATLEEILAQIPDGPEYDVIKFTIIRIAEDFPDELPEITPERVAGWVADVDNGVRDEYQIRSDIFTYIVTAKEIQRVYGVDAAEADKIISGEVSASDYEPVEETPGKGDQTPETKTFEEDEPDPPYVGGDVTILHSPTMKYYYDPTKGVWYISYDMPNSDKKVFFEATPAQMDSIFGVGKRPTSYTEITFEELAEIATFSGDIMDMSGEGSFEDEVQRVTELAMDEGTLPDWAADDPEIMDIIYIAHEEGKSAEWVAEQISQTASFKKRYPGFDNFIKTHNLTVEQGVQAWLEYEAGVREVLLRYGYNPEDVGPEIIGELIANGYSVNDVKFVYESFEYLKNNQDAMDAFNEVLAAEGYPPLTEEEQLEFLEGKGPAELYDLWEKYSFNQAAIDAGLDISVDEAIELAERTEGYTSRTDAYAALQKAAANILRFREDIALDRYDIDKEDLIDLSLGLPPRSGRSAAELSRNLERALQAGRAGIEGPRANRFRQFTQEGVPQAVSTSRARPKS